MNHNGRRYGVAIFELGIHMMIYHWHAVVLVERLVGRHRRRIDCWHTGRVDCRRKLLDGDVVDRRRRGCGCVVHGTVRRANGLWFEEIFFSVEG